MVAPGKVSIDEDGVKTQQDDGSNNNEGIKVQKKKGSSNNSVPGDQNSMHANEGNPKPRKSVLERMSMSYYVTNFPPYITSKDLWNRCAQWGVVSDVYIANRLSKAGKKFAFVRFIKVLDANKLLLNLKSMWIAKYKLFVDVVRFNRSFNNRPTSK